VVSRSTGQFSSLVAPCQTRSEASDSQLFRRWREGGGAGHAQGGAFVELGVDHLGQDAELPTDLQHRSAVADAVTVVACGEHRDEPSAREVLVAVACGLSSGGKLQRECVNVDVTRQSAVCAPAHSFAPRGAKATRLATSNTPHPMRCYNLPPQRRTHVLALCFGGGAGHGTAGGYRLDHRPRLSFTPARRLTATGRRALQGMPTP
jgi:hypothetical protein